MTVNLDITQIKKKRMKLYPAMLYYLATIVNRHSEFRTAINQVGELGIYVCLSNENVSKRAPKK